MAIAGSSFRKWYREHGIASQACTQCNNRTQEERTGRRWIDGKPFCSDCFFKLLSNELEVSPLHSPRINRG
jgi:hypothetical protein